MAIREMLELRGLNKLIREFEDYPNRVRKRHGRKAITKSARVLRKATKIAAPKDTGNLKKGLTHRVKTYQSGAIVGVVGSKMGGSAPHAHLVEYGTGKRKRKRIGGKFALFDATASPAKRKTGRGPAIKFLEKALNAHKREHIQILARELKAGLEAEARGGR